jgi:alpha-glucosidase (family GH31 glycosyl hydrolase)
VIGLPFLPPRWALGFQLSRWGYNSLEKMESVVDDMIAAKIPYDAQYGDIDYMYSKRDFTYDPVQCSNYLVSTNLSIPFILTNFFV